MIPNESMREALNAADPAFALRAAVEQLFREGHTKDQIYDALESLIDLLRARPAPRESDEDLVLDTMDALTGWCHPNAQLLPNDGPSKHAS